ncbi:peroxiredoxin [Pleomorphovibrio marinus]|uniref:peroxiredoxin n=1 Tax=Pleomorphovibrio marinus TaxID=2164132 RepID=UPI000E0C41A6|nr:peroxiredoxin [Pleomorphovibrio marinus]
MALEKGTKAPDFILPSTSGKQFHLSKDFGGKACIIYFYPKDFTKGCTAEACEFRDHFESFRELDIPIVGISRDTISSHQKFKKEHRLPFELLSDAKGGVCEDYDALIPIVRMPKRITYLLNKNHRIEAVFQDMFDAKSHISKMVEEVKNS